MLSFPIGKEKQIILLISHFSSNDELFLNEGGLQVFPRYLYSYAEQITGKAQADCVIIGSGIAGLYTALALDSSLHIILVTKDALENSNTYNAQGGIAAVLSAQDSVEQHIKDTCSAGAGLCEASIVEMVAREGPARVQDLITYGIQFDRENGQIALTQEGAHSHRRILHANGDATGAEIIRGLAKKVRQQPNITILEDTYTLDVQTEKGECKGVYVLTSQDTVHWIQAQAVILATGGLGQLYPQTTNPSIATGDGIAIALRAGADIQDMEFVQFHPTVLTLPKAPSFLISEAVRGEGAVLRNKTGERFMLRYHEQAELAPRDIVSRAILAEMEKTNHPSVYIDVTHIAEGKLKTRFPTIYHTCLSFGINIARDWIPVSPAAHYIMGGIRTDQNGQSSIKGLYACGETASTGVHGANRLASNSLTEAIVFGHRIAQHIAQFSKRSGPKQAEQQLHRDSHHQQAIVWKPDNAQDSRELESTNSSGGNVDGEIRLTDLTDLKQNMSRYAGVLRNGPALAQFLRQLKLSLQEIAVSDHVHKQEIEWRNMLTCCILITQSALLREESRGGHFRLDYPSRKDQEYSSHTVLYLDQATGRLKGRRIDVKR